MRVMAQEQGWAKTFFSAINRRLAMRLSRIRLELARDHDFPQGSSLHGYEMTVPLKPDGHIDDDAWRNARAQYRVRRFWQGEPDEHGHVVHKPGGAWAFHYDDTGDVDDDESTYRFADHLFRPGEYVSIREHEGRMRTYRIASITAA